MATTKTTIIAWTLLATAVVLMTLPSTKAQSPAAAPGPSPPSAVAAPGPSLDCTSYLLNASDCLSFVEAGSNLTKPEKGCCPELAGLVESQPICLCQLLGKSDSFGVQIDVKRALKLPSVCGVSTPPLSSCSANGVPVAPSPSPEGPAPSGGGTSLGSGNSDNGAPRIAATDLSFLLGLAIAFVTTFF
ncbi:unnamed protein product [Ilex paraguariensis]|uniref:Bifunctional inhibitor/plant lipid transfer protein/seed storage helical domain-containing protein n=1 Tax=Ilex paraguariensis TaxID=185542 RepID=A0ABC8TH45_9AQUA